MLAKLKGKVVTGPPGRYKIESWCAKGDVASDIATCWVQIGGVIPPPPVPPDPPPTPDPKPPAPIKEIGFRVMIIEDKETLGKLPFQQLSIRTSKVFRDYLDATCVIEPDGKTRAYRIWDHKETGIGDYKGWQDAMKRPRTTLPWLIISDHPRGGWEGPLPLTVQDTIKKLQEAKGN